MAQQVAELQEAFFHLLFREQEGFVCVSKGTPSGDRNKSWFDKYFAYPHEMAEMLDYINSISFGNNVYFCAQLLRIPKRSKDSIGPVVALWADLDACNPDIVEPHVPVVLETSPGRFHGFWPLDHEIDPLVAENYSRRFAFKYKANGVDPGGWDLTQVLRVPFTNNYKTRYMDKNLQPPMVTLWRAEDVKIPSALFEEIEDVAGLGPAEEVPPLPIEVPEYSEVLKRHRLRLTDDWFRLHDTPLPPGADWSTELYRLERLSFEAGMTAEEVFTVARTSQIDKFSRDRQPPLVLWTEVIRVRRETDVPWTALLHDEIKFPRLTDKTPPQEGFIQSYVAWASKQSDAAVQYHEIAAFVMLSAMLSGSIVMPLANIGKLRPNLWVLMVADTTLTRKTTAMEAAMEIVYEVDADTLLATDGSIEGMMRALSTRAGKPSIFQRDEFSGFMEAVASKDYMAGTLEALTKLYDGTHLRRVLSKETIDIQSPVVLVYAGSTRDKLFHALKSVHVSSGFIPRFLVVQAFADITAMKPLAKMKDENSSERDAIVQVMARLKGDYSQEEVIVIGAETIHRTKEIKADITDDALQFYNECEQKMVMAGYQSMLREVFTPVFDRMAKSMLKMAMLLAATRQKPKKAVIKVVKEDIELAAYYIQKWAPDMINLLENVDLSASEKQLEKVMQFIRENPGIPKSELMKRGRLTAWEMDAIEKTLTQRGQISTLGKGNLIRFFLNA